VGRAVSTYWFFNDQLTEQRALVFNQNKNILHAVIKKNYGDLDRLAAGTVSLQGMTEALFEVNRAKAQQLVEKSLSSYWWRLRLETDVSTIGVYDNYNHPLAIIGERNIPEDLIKDTNRSGQSQYGIACYGNCYIYATAPLLIEGVSVGSAIYAITFSSIITQFKDITGEDIALIRDAPGEIGKETFLNRWSSQVLGITERDSLLPILTEMASQTDMRDLSRKPLLFKSDDRYYEFAALPISVEAGSQAANAIAISNITTSVQSIRSLFLRSLFYDACGLVVLGLCLLGILWRPMNRLRVITSNIPLLATNEFEIFRDNLSSTEHLSRIRDESDALAQYATDLSFRLEAMQNQILERNAELEFQSKDLKREKDFVTRLLNTAHAVILTQDSNGNIVMANEYTCELTGYSLDEITGKKFSKLFQQQALPDAFLNQIDNLLTNQQETIEHESNLCCKNGDTLFMAWYHSVLPSLDFTENQILTVALNISERKKAEDHLGWLASHDSLTQLFNRRRFHQELEKYLPTCQHQGQHAALMFIDLDKFKDINDTSGHHVGDMLLKKVADVLKKQTRESDVVARFGGDEFAVLLKQTTREISERVAQRICASISSIEVQGEQHKHNGSCSIGIVLFPDDDHHTGGVNSADILMSADIAMYTAKKSGRNNWCFYDPVLLRKEDARERVHWDEMVKQSLEQNLIELFFQPIMHLKQRHIDHYECLMRIRENGKITPPASFIRAAESSGLMPAVDEHVIKLAFAHKRNLEQSGIASVLAINLSGLSFQGSNLAFHIQHCLDEFKINAGEIIFEITETTAVSDLKSSKQMMSHLKNLGFSFALDDFGAGFSSLSYLKQFPIDYIKIDGSFVKDILSNGEDQMLVKTIVDTARAFNLETIAEFVENRETLDLLESIGVDYVQGYHIDKPKAFTEVWAALREPVPPAADALSLLAARHLAPQHGPSDQPSLN